MDWFIEQEQEQKQQEYQRNEQQNERGKTVLHKAQKKKYYRIILKCQITSQSREFNQHNHIGVLPRTSAENLDYVR